MALESFFEVPEDKQKIFIDKNIIGLLPEKERGDGEVRAVRIVNDYMGADRDALSILAYATEQGKFDEFAGKLETHYKDNLIKVHPEARRVKAVPGAMKAAAFFVQCYQELGIRPQGNREDQDLIQTYLQ